MSHRTNLFDTWLICLTPAYSAIFDSTIGFYNPMIIKISDSNLIRWTWTQHFSGTQCNTLPGYSGRRPGYSGHGVSKSSKFFHLGPTTIKTNSSLSQLTLTLTLSRYSLSLSLPQGPSLSPNSRTQKSPFQINPKTKEAPISVGDHLLQVFHHGVALFLSFLARRACSRY